MLHITFMEPSSKPATAREPSGDKAQERAQAERGITVDFISKSPLTLHTYSTVTYYLLQDVLCIKKK